MSNTIPGHMDMIEGHGDEVYEEDHDAHLAKQEVTTANLCVAMLHVKGQSTESIE